MKRCPRILYVATIVLFAGLVGCRGQRLNYDKTITVSPGEVQSILIEAPGGEQKVTVDINSTGAPVDVYVALDEHVDAIKQALLNYKAPDDAKILASKKQASGEVLEAKIPGGKAFSVTLAGAKKK